MNRNTLIAVGAIAVLVAGIIVRGVLAPHPGSGTEGATIVMNVTGTLRADITYSLNADQAQENNASIPWRKTLTSDKAFTTVSVLAQNKYGGTIACQIIMNGEVVKENESSGEYAIVTCTADNL